MKTILVTGGAGYIGSHAVRALIKNGYKVVVADNFSKGHRAAVDVHADIVELDLANRDQLANLFSKYSFDAVLHFAGSIEVGLSMTQPAEFFQNNCVNGLNLLEAMRFGGVHTIIFSSTAAVYGNPETVPMSEDTKLEPTNFYGESKLIFERILEQYRKMFGFQFVALRYFNAAGADPSAEIGQDYEPATHLISRVLKTCLGQVSDLKIFGTDYPTPDGTCLRDYIHVCDLVDAHLLALDYLFSTGESNIFNLGNGNGFSVRQVLKVAEEITGKKIAVTEANRREGDPVSLVADSTRAKEILGWNPQFSLLEDIVGSAWKWQSSHPNGYGDRK